MGRDKGMMGDMFGNMSFDTSSEEEPEEPEEPEEESQELPTDPTATELSTLHSDPEVEVGYQPAAGGPPILVHQIRSQGLSFQLWPAATGMCQYLESGSLSLRGAHVVELGAGTGMAGVMAARLGAHVTLTDLPHVLHNLQRNVDLNAATCGDGDGEGSLTVAPLRWGVAEDVTTMRNPDFVIASDCVYYDSLFEPLMQTLKWLCLESDEKRKPAVVLLAHLRRWKKDNLFFRMAAKCFHVEVVHKVPVPDHARIGVVVYKFTRK